MRAVSFLVPILLGVVLSGCHQYAPAKRCIGGQSNVEIRTYLDDSSNAAVPLKHGDKLSGILISPGSLRIDSIGLQIGNGGGTADGKLIIKICQSGLCSTGEAQLAGSRDNDYLQFKLQKSLPITYEDGPLQYELMRDSGTKDVIVWTYPAFGKVTRLNIAGESQARTVNLVFGQQ